MKPIIAIPLALVLGLAATSVWADVDTILLAPRVYTEAFSDTENQDTRQAVDGQDCSEIGCSRSHGWGNGYVTHDRVGYAVREGHYNRMPQAKPPAPAPLPPSIKPTQVVAGYFRVNQNSQNATAPQDVIALTNSGGGCHLHYMLNKGADGDGQKHLGWDVGLFIPSNTWTASHFVSGQSVAGDSWWVDDNGTQGEGDGINDSDAHCQADADMALSGENEFGTALFAGDFDSDGFEDVIYLRAANRNRAGLLDHVYIFWNEGTQNAAGVPNFSRARLASNTGLYDKGIAWHLSADIGEVSDLNGDNRDDLILASSSGSAHKVFVFTQRANATREDPFLDGQLLLQDPHFATAADASNLARTNTECGASGGAGRGITALAVGDYNGDGAKDIVIGSISETHLGYFFNNGANQFSRTSLTYAPGGVTSLHTGNWNLEGGEDLLATRSALGCNGAGTFDASLWLFENTGSVEERDKLRAQSTPIAPVTEHVHYATALDLDHDEDGYIDFMMGTNRSWGSYYYYVHNIWKGLYNADAVIMSERIDNFNPREEAIVRATLQTAIAEGYDSDTMDVKFYLTNNGIDWDELPLDELPPSVGGTGPSPHVFTSFGTDLRWAIVSSVPAISTVGDDENAALSDTDEVAKEVPRFLSMVLNVSGVGPSYYSRSGLSQKVGGDDRIIYSASFEYPGNEGYLRAYDLTDAAIGQTQSGVNPGPNPHLTLKWEAGALLQARSASSRRFLTYTMTAPNQVGSLVELSEGSPELQTLLGTSDSETATEIFEFVRSGMGHDESWKLYDVGHSSPNFVGPPMAPADYVAYSANSYANFQNANQNRNGTVYIGSNGGGVHAFDAETGHEKWLLIPNNLMSKLPRLRDDDGLYRHDYTMDGSVVVHDIYNEQLSEWRTILIAGQAKGVGGDGSNYYFALDITNPGVDPIPLWEFTDAADNVGQVCSGIPQYSEEVCQPGICDDSCDQDNRVYEQQTVPVLGNAVVIDAGYADSVFGLTVQTGAQHSLKANAGMTACPRPSSTLSLGEVYGANCASAQYKFNVATADNIFHAYFKVRNLAGTADELLWFSLDNDEWYAGNQTPISVPATTEWTWVKSNLQPDLGSGEHDLVIWAMNENLEIDTIVIATEQVSADSITAAIAADCLNICQPQVCQTLTRTIPDPANMEWPECGAGEERKCCSYQADTAQYLEGGSFCRPLAESCADSPPDAAMGETWSEPSVGRVRLNMQSRWLVFFGSGYSNLNNSNVGRTIYALDAYTGEKLKDWTLKEEAAGTGEGSAELPEINIENALAASPILVDTSTPQDESGYGYVDRLYIGDLEGRLWKLAMDGALRDNIEQWKRCVIFDAGDSDGDGTRNWAPIITKPQVAMIEPGKPNVYFGTGGDDRAPDDVRYKFYAVRDEEAPGVCSTENDPSLARNEDDLQFGNTGKFEWVMGDGYKNSEWPREQVNNAGEEGESGDRYWSDPLIVDNELIYFASLPGKIESVDPTVNLLGGDSKLYCVAIRDTTEGNDLKAGEPCWNSGSVFERESVKIRKALMVQGVVPEAWARDGRSMGTGEADLMYQRFSESDTPPPTLVHRGTSRSGLIKILRWREIPL